MKTNPDQEILSTAQKCLNIETVNLFSSSIVVREDIDPQSLNLSDFLSQNYRSVTSVDELEVTLEDGDKAWIYKYIYRIGNRLINQGDEEASKEKGFKPALEITATFSAKYFSKNKVSEECIAEFAKENVGYNVWPFWREYVHSTCSRMGLSPVLEIPLYTVSKKAQK